jgi:hypothetical protein
MDCLECKNLEETFESRLSQYIEACSAAYYRGEHRARSQEKRRYGAWPRATLEEHQLVCVFAAKVRQSGPRASRMDFCTTGCE